MRIALPLILLAALASGACTSSSPPDASVASTQVRWFGSVSAPTNNVFRYCNGAEPEMFDPSLAVGEPDGKVCRLMFEGLMREDPRTLEPRPGMAYRWDLSPDGRVYTFHLRPGIVWSDGKPVTAGDFLYGWRRVLEPANAARYSSMLYPVLNAERYNVGALTDFDSVGIAAPDDSTFVVTLASPTAFFLYLTQFYTCMPIPRWAVEKAGSRWVRPENAVTNGAYRLTFWRQNDRFVFAKNPTYWDAASVSLDGIVGYSIDDLNTNLNLYKSGQVDWLPSGYFPSQYIPNLRTYGDYRHAPYQGVYFYSVNVTRKPYDNPWVRRALNLSIDRDAICNDLLKKSRDPWGNFSPDGYPGYQHPKGFGFEPERARECMAKAGFPGGKGFPKISILFNTSEDHRKIAEALQVMWKRELGIDVELENQEWGSFLQATSALQYDVARRSWIGDFLDPVTFLGLGITADGNNRTGWSDPAYDALMRRAAFELDPAKRLALLAEAEAKLLWDGPFIPIYHYMTNELVKPYVRGLYPTPLNIHPLTQVSIDRDWRNAPPPVSAALTRDPHPLRGARVPSALLGSETP